MRNISTFIFLATILVGSIFFVRAVFFFFKNKPKFKTTIRALGITAAVCFLSIVGMVAFIDEKYEAEQAKIAEVKAAEQVEKDKVAAEVKAKQEAEDKAVAEVKAIADAKAEAKAKAKAKEEAKIKAEQEAKTKAEKESKAKADAETKAKAKVVAEAKAKADAETKAKAEAAAKKKASEDEKAKVVAEAKAKVQAEEKEKAEAEAKKQREADRKTNMKTIPYAQLKKNPDKYATEISKYTGQILEIQESEERSMLRLAVTKTSYGYDFNDVIWVEYEGSTEFVDEDIVTVYGIILGSYSYTSQAGWEISIPAMYADEIE